MRILIRPRWPVVALLLLAPSIPELLTGSTPITTLFFAPAFFAISFLGIVGLYGAGALLIREFVVYFQKGWASVLLLGAAYGIGEEGFAVHTFFEPSGVPVDALGSYGHALGVNWLWAPGLTIFHATYSIALPILLVGLIFPHERERRWLDRGSLAVTAAVYLFVVVLFSIVVGHGPSPSAFAFFLVVSLALIGLARWAPRDLLRPRAGPMRAPPWALAVVAALPFAAWTIVLIFSTHPLIPAWGAALFTVIVGLLAVGAVLRFGGTERPEWTKFYLATGMLGILFAWDAIVEFAIPGILLVTLVFVYLLYWLRRRMRSSEPPAVPAGAVIARPSGR
ncbi:MAG: hypothetical protein L3K02_03665 [Thermoplasmata archaeon]|nr:hypothetical protein [Thermoplasmata archaeon]